MKDSYSFDVDDEGLQARRTRRHREAYIKDLRPARPRPTRSVCAPPSGAMGGSRLRGVPRAHGQTGEDTFVRLPPPATTPANVEAVTTTRPPAAARRRTPAPREVLDTPDTPTIETLGRLPQRPPRRSPASTAADTLKNVVVKLDAAPTRRDRWLVGVPGDREVDLQAARGAARRPAEAGRSSRPPTSPGTRPGPKGYIGPQVLGEELRHPLPGRPPRRRRHRAGSPAPTSPARTSSNVVAGPRLHPRRHDRGRRGRATATPALVRRRPARATRGIEIGHIFQLGRKYADAARPQRARPERQAGHASPWAPTASASPARSPSSPSRAHDELGLCWPREVAPADVHMVAAGKDDQTSRPP